jgi:hypothetical protein
MISYATEGAPMTGAKYRKRPFGPTCDDLLNVLPEMEHDGLLRVDYVNYFGYTKKEFTPLVHFTSDRLSEAETRLIDEVADFVCNNNTAKTISEFSHSKPWEMVEFGEELPYHSAYNLFPTEVSQQALHWAKNEIVKVAATGSKKDALGYEDFASFRSRFLQAGSHI